MKLAIKQLRRG